LRLDRMYHMPPLAFTSACCVVRTRVSGLPHRLETVWISLRVCRIGIVAQARKPVADDEEWQVVPLRHLRETHGTGSILIEPAALQVTSRICLAPKKRCHRVSRGRSCPPDAGLVGRICAALVGPQAHTQLKNWHQACLEGILD